MANRQRVLDELARHMARLSSDADGFHNPTAARYERGRYSPEGYFENSYNYAALILDARWG
jgi:uridine kinase